MFYDAKNVMKAFELYTKLARDGLLDGEDFQQYMSNDEVFGLLEQYTSHMECVLFVAANQLYMVPKTTTSQFHVNNEYLRKTYLKSGATNSDLYLSYFATIVLLGEFYNSYLTKEPTIHYLSLSRWVEAIDERMEVLVQHPEDRLKELERQHAYNWLSIIENWTTLDAIKESAKSQKGQTLSRLSFIHTVKKFLVKEKVINEIGNDEVELTEKTKMIVQRYFMNLEHNNEILQFLYDLEPKEGAFNADYI
ncbi:DUF6063 family protein [Psychrobacillus psychrodurans]|uniref:DUF6063 family protein n=1 Tax=Psychrobacillus psychrodurans TaxID=126157 RepID=UPI001F4EF1DB|nr:DUF6063 family protein [Psychrobacillus psychrodurans]MCK1998496.1 DUF6063 family protein [Psychrobacillus psychrodurans]